MAALKRIILVGALPESLLNFRGELLQELVRLGHQVTAMAAPASPAVVTALEAMGVRFRPYRVARNSPNPLTDIRTFIDLRRAFREVQPDIVLAYTVKPIVWSGFALRVAPRARFYALVTGLGFAFQGASFARRGLSVLVAALYRRALVRASRVVFQNPENLETFVESGIAPRARCAVVNGSGVNLETFRAAPMPGGAPVFLAIGRLLGEKGFREYAEAARLIKSHYPNVSLRLLGPADPSPDGIPLAEVRAWHESGVIEYLGEARDVRPALGACHIFTLPSYHEGMPRTALEALAVGRPVLTTDVPGCRATVRAGENGFLVRPRDAQALAERMIWFVEHRDAWDSMGKRSRRLAEERFNVRSVVASLCALMDLKSDGTTHV